MLAFNRHACGDIALASIGFSGLFKHLLSRIEDKKDMDENSHHVW
jgi:hypothetical protein